MRKNLIVVAGSGLAIVSVLALDILEGKITGNLLFVQVLSLAALVLALAGHKRTVKLAACIFACLAFLYTALLIVPALELILYFASKFLPLGLLLLSVFLGVLAAFAGSIVHLVDRSTVVPDEADKRFLDHVLNPLLHYARFSGRACRKEYWSFTLLTLPLFLAFQVWAGSIEEVNRDFIFLLVVLLVLLLPSVAVSVRRLHDTGRSGRMLLLSLIPLVGQLVLLDMFCEAGSETENRYGPGPIRAVGNEGEA